MLRAGTFRRQTAAVRRHRRGDLAVRVRTHGTAGRDLDRCGRRAPSHFGHGVRAPPRRSRGSSISCGAAAGRRRPTTTSSPRWVCPFGRPFLTFSAPTGDRSLEARRRRRVTRATVPRRGSTTPSTRPATPGRRPGDAPTLLVATDPAAGMTDDARRPPRALGARPGPLTGAARRTSATLSGAHGARTPRPRVSGPPAGRERLARTALYLGGFLGPFGGGVIVVLIPELQRTFDASPEAVTAGLTAYLLPFAALQLVSGTIGERLGRRRTIRWAFLAYAVTSFGVALDPEHRAVPRRCGRCRARRTRSRARCSWPRSPSRRREERLGRSMGTFAAVQTAGMVIAPLCGGLLGAIEPRLAFAVPGARGARCSSPRRCRPGPRAPGETRARLRDAFNRRSTTVATAGFLAYLAINGVAFLVALRAADPLRARHDRARPAPGRLRLRGRARGTAGGRAGRRLRAAAGVIGRRAASARRWSRRSGSRAPSG